MFRCFTPIVFGVLLSFVRSENWAIYQMSGVWLARPLVLTLRLGVGLQSPAEIQFSVLVRGVTTRRFVCFLLGISHSRSGGEWSFMRLIWFQSNRRPHLAISYSFGSIRSTHARQPTPMDPVLWTIHFFLVLNVVIRISFPSGCCIAPGF